MRTEPSIVEPAQAVAQAPVVVVATKGRARETFQLLDSLERQTRAADRIVIVGVETADLAGIDEHDLTRGGVVRQVLAAAGLTIQRNAGLAVLSAEGALDHDRRPVVFFDDDFRPAADWLERCSACLQAQPDVVGVTGRVLADGVRDRGLSEDDAGQFLADRLPPQRHWSDRSELSDVESLYGCNMAFAANVVRLRRFNEALPLYGWQEDCDFTGQARAFGRTVIVPQCRGVHLGVKAGRTSGLRFGYSQIANPIHIASRRRMPATRAARFVVRALAANALRSLTEHPLFDYRGRLNGNARALVDLLRGRCEPDRILSLR